MRVLMISDVCFPRVNGVSTSIESFRRQLGHEGIEVDLIAPAYPHDFSDDAAIHRIPSRRIPFDPEDRLMSRAAAVAAGLCLRPDLIHIQTPFVAHYTGIELARRHGVPVVATYHTLFEEYLQHYLSFLPRAPAAALARRLSARQCNQLDAMIVPSAAMHDRLRQYGVRRPIEILPTGIPLERFGQGDGRAFRLRHGIPPEYLVALFVGRVAGEKNIDFLLRVATLCRASHPRLLWLIAGEGPALPGLKARAAELGLDDAIRFVGYLDRDRELADCYAAADLFTFASLTETQGLVLLEAMAAGLPVVALAEMGTRDIVGPGRGAVVPAHDADAFADAVKALLDDPPRRRRLAAEAREWAAEWSEQTMGQRLAAFYRRCHADRETALAAPGVA